MNLKKVRKGFVLFELIIYMAILMIVFSVGFISIKKYTKVSSDIVSSEFSNSLIDFINNAKKVCRENNKGGFIYFDIGKEKIDFSMSNKLVKSIKLNDSIDLISINTHGNNIYINNQGMTKNACTIKFKDNSNKIHNITICVGTAYVQIKN
ncbi:peptidase [Clostridium oceanicum]|uniref:Prepilin-type N-terminal cleavage/methylation domain-containing protein n=1 Tax=Clostridium oceanicum TaxID=1543 RepID=A0ABP3UZ52_9CLOT